MNLFTNLKLQDLDVRGKRVLMRVDFNVPLDEEGHVADDARIRAAVPSIQYVIDHGGSVILMSHLGRPKNGPDPALSLKPCARILSQLLHRPVILADDCVGPEVERMAKNLNPGEVLLLENVRFHAAEEEPSLDPAFARYLASLGELYVNDAFGAAHRAHSSTAIIAQYFPEKAAAGLLMQKEIEALSSLLMHPKRPFYAIVGGAKIATKIGVLHALTEKADALFIGGGMAYPFLQAQGMHIGDSPCNAESVSLADALLKQCAQKKLSLYLPVDLVIADAFKKEAHVQIISVHPGIPQGWQGMDIGPQTVSSWQHMLKQAATIFWNGPVGVFEFAAFAKGTHAIAHALADAHATTVVGGGDSISAINHLHLSSHFTHISTGGGASLEFIEKGHLPGIDALSNYF